AQVRATAGIQRPAVDGLVLAGRGPGAAELDRVTQEDGADRAPADPVIAERVMDADALVVGDHPGPQRRRVHDRGHGGQPDGELERDVTVVSNHGLGCKDDGKDQPGPPDDEGRTHAVDRLPVGGGLPLPPLTAVDCLALVLHETTLCAVTRRQAPARHAETASAAWWREVSLGTASGATGPLS